MPIAIPTWCVERVGAVTPRDRRLPGGEHVVQRPCHQHRVEYTANACDADHSGTDSFTHRHVYNIIQYNSMIYKAPLYNLSRNAMQTTRQTGMPLSDV